MVFGSGLSIDDVIYLKHQGVSQKMTTALLEIQSLGKIIPEMITL